MTRPIAEIVIHFSGGADDVSGGGTKVPEALRRVLELCRGQKIQNDAHHQLCEWLRQLFNEFETTPELADDIVDEYVAALEEFWRVLDSYEDKTVVERLLNLTNVSDSITDVHNEVKKLFGKIGLEVSDLEGWEKLHATNTTKERNEREDTVKNAAKLK